MKITSVIPEPEICTQIIAGIVRSKHDNKPIDGATVTLVDRKGNF